MTYNLDRHAQSVQEATNQSASGKFQLVELTAVLDHGTAYAKGDVLFNTVELPNFFPRIGMAAKIESLVIIDEYQMAPDLTLYLTTNSGNFGTINETAGAADSVMTHIQCVIPVVAADYQNHGDYLDTCAIANITSAINTPSTRAISGIGTIVQADSDSTSIYACAVLQSSAGEDWSSGEANDLKFKIGVSYC